MPNNTNQSRFVNVKQFVSILFLYMQFSLEGMNVKTKSPCRDDRKKRMKRLVQYFKNEWLLYLIILPGLVYFIVFKYLPMYGLKIAFQDYSVYAGFENAKWVGLSVFTKLFKRMAFRTAFRNNIIISVLKLVCGFPVPIILSLMINEVRRKPVKKLYQTAVILPNLISWVVVYSFMYTLFNLTDGVIPGVLRAFDYAGPIKNILGEKETFRMTLVLSDIWKTAGMTTIIYLSAITGIDPGLYEAAQIDGAGKLKQMWYITLSSIRSTVVIMLIFRVGSIMHAGFDQIFVLNNSLVTSVADIIDTYVYRVGLKDLKYSEATAAGLMQSGIGFILVMITNFIAKKIDPDSGIM